MIRRESGVLKRVRGTPLPPAGFLGAVIVSILVVIGIEALLQVLIGRYVLDAGLSRISRRAGCRAAARCGGVFARSGS